MEVFRGLWVNVFEMFGWLSGVSAFFVFERPVRALHAELAVEGEQRRVAVCSSRICSSFLLLLRVSCSKPPWALLFFLCAISASLPVLAYCLAHQWPVLYLCDISVISLCYLCHLALGLVFALCYLCAISVLSMRPCAGDWFLLCAISVLSMLSHSISVLSLWYSLKSLFILLVIYLKLGIRNSQFQIWWCPEAVDLSMFCPFGGHGVIRGLCTGSGLATV